MCPWISDEERTPKRLGPINDFNVPLIRFRQLEHTLKSNEEIAGCIRTLHYNSHPSNFSGNHVVKLLDKLNQLETLRMIYCISLPVFGDQVEDNRTREDDNYVIYCAPVDWRRFPQGLQNSLVKLINLPSFRKLDMEHVVDFPAELSTSSRLQKLHLAHCRLTPNPSSMSGRVESPSAQLKLLYLAPGARSNVKVLHAALDLSPLQDLIFEFVYLGDEQQMGELFELTPHLDTLTLRIGIDILLHSLYFDSDCMRLSGRRCPDLSMVSTILSTQGRVFLGHLRHLHLANKLEPWALPKLNDFLFFNVLKNIPSWDVLESVDITLEEVPQFSDYHVKDLEKLDRHLSDTSIFPALRKVSISVELVINCAIDDYNPDNGPWSKLPDTHMVNLAHSSIDFNYSIGDFPGYTDYGITSYVI